MKQITINQVTREATLSEKMVSWYHRENNLISSMVEEKITNKQLILIGNTVCSLAFTVLMGGISVPVCAAGAAWFVVSTYHMRKGGLK